MHGSDSTVLATADRPQTDRCSPLPSPRGTARGAAGASCSLSGSAGGCELEDDGERELRSRRPTIAGDDELAALAAGLARAAAVEREEDGGSRNGESGGGDRRAGVGADGRAGTDGGGGGGGGSVDGSGGDAETIRQGPLRYELGWLRGSRACWVSSK